MARCSKYEMLCMIFGSFVVTGMLHCASTNPIPYSDDERHLKVEMHNRGNMEKQSIDFDIDEMQNKAHNKGKQLVGPIDVDEMDVSKRYKKLIFAPYTHPAYRINRKGYSIKLLEELGLAIQEMAKICCCKDKGI